MKAILQAFWYWFITPTDKSDDGQTFWRWFITPSDENDDKATLSDLQAWWNV